MFYLPRRMYTITILCIDEDKPIFKKNTAELTYITVKNFGMYRLIVAS